MLCRQLLLICDESNILFSQQAGHSHYITLGSVQPHILESCPVFLPHGVMC